MLIFGYALYGAWLAPVSIRRLMMRRFLRPQQYAAAFSFVSALTMLVIQSGLMGNGWQDVVSPQFGPQYYKHDLVTSGFGKLFLHLSPLSWH